MYVTESAIPLCQRGLPADEMFVRIDCMGVRDLLSAHPQFTNVVSNVLLIFVDKLDYEKDLTEDGSKWMPRPEKKSAALMTDLVQEFLKPEDCELDVFFGTLFTANACLLLHKHRRFMRCEKDFGCMEKLMSGLVNVEVCPLLKAKYDLTLAKKLME